MVSTKQRGFTLIELLVVIAIIGLLAAVVLASVGSARTKGVDAAVKSQLALARSQAELYATNNNNSYASVCTAAASSNGLASILTGAASPTGASVFTAGNAAETSTQVWCNSTASAWVIQAPMSANYWCVDSTGNSKQENAVIGSGATACT